MPERRRLRAAGVVVLVAAVSVLEPTGGASAECPSAAGRAIADAPDPVPRAEVVFRGHGLGHGLGMSQYGAQGAARLGCGYAEILRTYYRGTHVTAAPMPSTVTVRMVEDVGRVWVTVLRGSVGWRNGGRLVAVQRGGTVVVHRLSAGSVELVKGTTRLWAGTVAAGGLTATHWSGVIRLSARGDVYGKLPIRLRWDWLRINVDRAGIDVVKVFRDNRSGPAMDKYLLGLAEVPVTWPHAALRAQAVAARTFAYQRNGQMLPTVSHQNYAGFDHEAVDAQFGSHWRDAVGVTTRRIVVDGANRSIDALYSSSMGGWTEDKVYSWGGAPISYLRAVNDAQWDRASDNPAGRRAWSIGFTRRRVAAALGFTSVTSVSAYPRGDPRRPAGVRVIGVKDGRAVTQWLPGFTVRNALGLPSPGFVVKNN